MNFNNIVILFFMTTFSSSVLASDQIKAGYDVRLNKFIKKCDCFEIIIVKEPSVGPNYATLKSLVDGLNYEGGLPNLSTSAKSLEGKNFKLKKNLQLIPDEKALEMDLE